MSTVTTASVLTGDSWPKATSATDTPTLPSGTGTKYTAQAGLDTAGSSAPVLDHGDGGVEITDGARRGPYTRGCDERTLLGVAPPVAGTGRLRSGGGVSLWAKL
ncbi:MAG TPA: hypothetical protein VGK53_07190, partial [Propionicimonas sp.]